MSLLALEGERSISVATNGGAQAAFNSRDFLFTHTHKHTLRASEKRLTVPV